jgi:hypothetical protein
LLPFLAANHTHKTGPHRNIVKKALEWMISNQQSNGCLLAKGDMQEMYSHGLATIVLCEAYGLTKDAKLLEHAKRAVNFTVKVQNKTGGWHYMKEMQTADTSVFGWQLMSLKSAQMAGIDVPAKTLDDAKRYLANVSYGPDNSNFEYMKSNKGNPISMTAVGLLCQQYLGRGRSDPTIATGVQFLLKTAPPEKTTEPYYWYYSTQVIHHYQGPEWERWNRSMRRIWVERQNRDTKSTDFGSWNPKDFGYGHDLKAGGRHYLTCIGLLTLEVYYRYLPLYEVMNGEPKKMAKAN